MSLDIPPGSQFPDLGKALLNKNLQDIVKGLIKDDKEVFQLAQDKKVELNKQREIDLKSFWGSQSGAIQRGNNNSCHIKAGLNDVAEAQANNTLPIVMPDPVTRKPYGKGKKQIKVPKNRIGSPTFGNRSLPPSITRLSINPLLPDAISQDDYYLDSLEPNTYPDKSERNMRQFIKGQSGSRGISIGDRAVVFTASGTPMYGDSYLDKNAQENFSANQATSNLPVAQIPRDIKKNKPMGTGGMQSQPRANIVPKSDTTGNMIVLGAIGAAVTAVLFLFQHILIFVQMILQISSVTSTITNIAGSFVAILNNLGSLFGLGEGLVEPISSTFDSILNNTFGKDRIDYVKFQFAKVSSGFVAGQNLLNKVRGLDNTIGKVTEKNANNTSIIGNALKAMGMISGDVPWMDEDNKVNVVGGKVGIKLDKVSGLSNSLSEISSDVKTQVEEQKNFDKEEKARLKSDRDGTKKSTESNSDKDIPDLQTLGGSE